MTPNPERVQKCVREVIKFVAFRGYSTEEWLGALVVINHSMKEAVLKIVAMQKEKLGAAPS